MSHSKFIGGGAGAPGLFGRRSYQLEAVTDAPGALSRMVAPATLDKDSLVKSVHDLYERVNVLTDRGEIDPGKDERANLETGFRELAAKVGTLETGFAEANRTKIVTEDSMAGLGGLLTRLDPPNGMDRLHFNIMGLTADELSYAGVLGRGALPGLSREAEAFSRKHGMSDVWRARLYEVQALNDLILLTDQMLCGDGGTEYAQRSASRSKRIKGLKVYRDYAALVKEFQRGTALDTQTAGEGLEWVPTMWSSQMIGLIQAQLVIAPLFSTTIMPTPTYVSPVLGQDMIAYKASEGTEEGATAIPSNTFVTAKMTLTAVKMATRIMASSEITEDSVVNIAPLIQAQIAKSIARAMDDAIVNGDTTVTQDADVTSATDRRACWDGLRKYAMAYTGANIPKVDAGGTLPLTYSDLMNLKKNMGAYGAVPSMGSWVAGFRSIIELMQAKDANGNQVFLTLEKYGPNAIVLTGELGRVAGSPVLLSEFCREDLASTGFNSGVAADDVKGCIMYVNREGFTRGERRALTITRSAERYIETDQLVFVGTWRGDFKPYYTQPTNKLVGILYNVA